MGGPSFEARGHFKGADSDDAETILQAITQPARLDELQRPAILDSADAMDSIGGVHHVAAHAEGHAPDSVIEGAQRLGPVARRVLIPDRLAFSVGESHKLLPVRNRP